MLLKVGATGMKIEQYLKKNNLSHAAFARQVGLSHTHIRNYLQGTTPNLKAAMKMVKLTNGDITYEDLVTKLTLAVINDHLKKQGKNR
jgi:hypothetical protein